MGAPQARWYHSVSPPPLPSHGARLCKLHQPSRSQPARQPTRQSVRVRRGYDRSTHPADFAGAQRSRFTDGVDGGLKWQGTSLPSSKQPGPSPAIPRTGRTFSEHPSIVDLTLLQSTQRLVKAVQQCRLQLTIGPAESQRGSAPAKPVPDSTPYTNTGSDSLGCGLNSFPIEFPLYERTVCCLFSC